MTLRWDASVLIAAGLAFFLADVLNALPALREGTPFSVASAEPAFVAHALLQWIGAGLVLVSIPSLLARQRATAGAAGVITTAILGVGMMFFVGWSFALGVALPSAAQAAPAVFDDNAAFGGATSLALGIGFPLIFLAHLAFGGVALWKRAFPWPVGALFVASPILTVALDGVLPIGGLAASGAAFAWAGAALHAPARGPPRAANEEASR